MVPDFEFFLPSDDDTPYPPSCVVCDATENLTERIWPGPVVSTTNPRGDHVVYLCPPCLEADDEEDNAQTPIPQVLA
jgi:hypothetical protein